jgi:hypothetical protein
VVGVDVDEEQGPPVALHSPLATNGVEKFATISWSQDKSSPEQSCPYAHSLGHVLLSGMVSTHFLVEGQEYSRQCVQLALSGGQSTSARARSRTRPYLCSVDARVFKLVGHIRSSTAVRATTSCSKNSRTASVQHADKALIRDVSCTTTRRRACPAQHAATACVDDDFYRSALGDRALRSSKCATQPRDGRNLPDRGRNGYGTYEQGADEGNGNELADERRPHPRTQRIWQHASPMLRSLTFVSVAAKPTNLK